MSVVKKVKKFAPGGPIDSPNNPSMSLENFLIKKRDELSYTKDAKNYVNSAMSAFNQLGTKEDLNKVLSYDKINNEYSINRDNINDANLKAQDWSGSKNHGKTNFFGTYNDKDIDGEVDSGRKKYMGLVASWANEWNQLHNQGNQSQSSNGQVTPSGQVYNLAGYNNYLQSQTFGGQKPDFEQLLGKDTSNENRQKVMMNTGSGYLQTFLDEAKGAKNGDVYNNLPKIQEALNAAKSGNWDDFVVKSRAIGWNPLQYMLKPEQLKVTEDQNTAKQTEQNRVNFVNSLRTNHISEGTSNELFKNGFTNLSTELPGGFATATDTQKVALANWFKEKGISVASDKDGNEHLIGKPFQNEYLKDNYKLAEHDINSPLNGTYIGKDENGKITFYNNAHPDYNASLFPNPGDEGSWRRIEGLAKNNSANQIYGVNERDASGNLVSTNRLVIHEPTGDTEVTKDEHGIYRDDKENIVPVSLKGYNNSTAVQPLHKLILHGMSTDAFNEVQPVMPQQGEDLEKTFTALNREGVNYTTAPQWKNLIANLKYQTANASGTLQRNKYAELYGKLYKSIGTGENSKPLFKQTNNPEDTVFSKDELQKIIRPGSDNIIAKQVHNPLTETILVGVPFLHLKKGGYLRKLADGGGFMSQEEYNNRLKLQTPQNTSTNTDPNSGQVKDTSGTFKDMDFLKGASLAGSVASIIPGVGAIGGAVSTLADIAEDLKNGKSLGDSIFNWNTAANLGFTALGLVGAGGLKGISLAAKAGKEAMAVDKGLLTAEKLGQNFTAAEKTASDLVKTLSPEAINSFKALSDTKDVKLASIFTNPEEIEALKKAKIVSPNGVKFTDGVVSNLNNILKTADGLANKAPEVVENFTANLSSLDGGINKAKQIVKSIGTDINTPEGKIIDRMSKVPNNLLEKLVASDNGTTKLVSALGVPEIDALTKAGYIAKGAEVTPSLIYDITKNIASDATKVNQFKLGTQATGEFAGTEKFIKNVTDKDWGGIGNTVGYGLGALGLANAGYSGFNVAKDLVNDPSSVNVEQLKNTLQGVSAVRGFLKNRQMANLVNQVASKAPAVGSSIELGGHTIPINNLIEIPELKGYHMLGIGKEASEKANTQIFKDISSKIKLANPEIKKDLVTSAETYNELKSKLGGLEYGPSSFAASKLSLGDYNRVKGVMSGKTGNYWLPSYWNRKEGGILKFQSGSSLDPSLFTNIISNNTWSNDNSLFNPQTQTQNPNNSSIITSAFSNILKMNIPKDTQSLAGPEQTGDGSGMGGFLDGLGKSLNKPGVINTIANTGILAKTLASNNSNLRMGILANHAGFSATPLAQRTLVKTGSQYLPYSQGIANDTMSMAKRIAGTSSHIDKGNAAMFQGNSNASKVLLDAQARDSQAIDNARNQQASYDTQTAQTNVQIGASNAQKQADINKNDWLLRMNANSVNTGAVNDWLKGTVANVNQQREQDKQTAMGLNMYNAMKNTGKDIATQEANLNTNVAAWQKDWEKNNLYDTNGNMKQDKPDWTKTTGANSYAAYQSQLKNINEQRDTFNQNRSNAMMAYRLGIQPQYWAAGGTLSDRLALEDARAGDRVSLQNVKDKHKAELNDTQMFYKSMLADNQLMQKSLIKVFK